MANIPPIINWQSSTITNLGNTIENHVKLSVDGKVCFKDLPKIRNKVEELELIMNLGEGDDGMLYVDENNNLKIYRHEKS